MDQSDEPVEKIIKVLGIAKEEYKKLVQEEILERFFVDVQFVFNQTPIYTPSELETKTEKFVHKILDRDMRLFVQTKMEEKTNG